MDVLRRLNSSPDSRDIVNCCRIKKFFFNTFHTIEIPVFIRINRIKPFLFTIINVKIAKHSESLYFLWRTSSPHSLQSLDNWTKLSELSHSCVCPKLSTRYFCGFRLNAFHILQFETKIYWRWHDGVTPKPFFHHSLTHSFAIYLECGRNLKFLNEFGALLDAWDWLTIADLGYD